MTRQLAIVCTGLGTLVCASNLHAELVPPVGETDPRVRTVPYDPQQVYHLNGFVGFAIHLVFAPNESFSGMGGGDVEGISWDADSNHLFIKPRQPRLTTNLTLITTHRAYEIHYSAGAMAPDTPVTDITYAVHFIYPEDARRLDDAQTMLDQMRKGVPVKRNEDYWYCGAESLKPIAAWDDGTRTWIQFAPTTEWPAVFALGEDGEESLINFNVNGAALIVHRVAPRFVFRRGKLVGCVLNRGFAGASTPTATSTSSPDVKREIRGRVP